MPATPITYVYVRYVVKILTAQNAELNTVKYRLEADVRALRVMF